MICSWRDTASQCHWSFLVWFIPIPGTVLNWNSHPGASDHCQQWVTAFVHFFYADFFPYTNILHSLGTYHAEGCHKPLSTCTSCILLVLLVLCCLFISLHEFHDFLFHWQNCDCVFNPTKTPFTYAESFNLYP